MKRWKSTLTIALAFGLCMAIVTFAVAEELTVFGKASLSAGIGVALFIVWDQVYLRDVDTVHAIVQEKNIALAIFSLVPVLLGLCIGVVLANG